MQISHAEFWEIDDAGWGSFRVRAEPPPPDIDSFLLFCVIMLRPALAL